VTGHFAWDRAVGPDGDPAGPRQNVRAEGGFAYGVVGADIHVFGDGTPLYLLENWRSAPQPDPRWLRELPSRMLNARHAVVPFTGREAELADLVRWRDEDHRFGVRWLHGPGGQGKTRLAAELAARSGGEGWKVVSAVHGPGTVLPPPGSQDLRPAGARGLLVVVDYADRWPLTYLTWLFSNALLYTSVPTRVLLLARTADLWPAVRAALANHQASTSSQALLALRSQESDPRMQMFRAACDAFAAHYGLVPPVGVDPPGALDHTDFGLTLAVHVAALVAVDARSTGGRPPPGMAGLTIYLLDREHLQWERLYGDGTREFGPDRRAYSTPPSAMNQAVFTAALTGPLTPSSGTAVLHMLGLPPGAQQVAADHAVCYAPADPARRTVLEPLYPDRLAEDFLALTLAGHTADYPARGWAALVVQKLLARDGEGAPPGWTSRAVTFLATAAERWPHVGSCHLFPLLRNDPRLAVDAGGAALSALARVADPDPALLEAVAEHFPRGEQADLDAGVAALAVRLAPHRLARATGPAESVLVHHDLLAQRLHFAGRDSEALAAVEQAVKLILQDVKAHRAEADGTATEAASAIVLTTHAALLSGLGRNEQARAVSTVAVATWNRLLEERQGHHPRGRYTAYVLGTTVNHVSYLLEAGQSQHALSAAEAAVTGFRLLDRADPAAFGEKLNTSLNLLAMCQSAAGHPDQAIQTLTEAVSLGRRLVEAYPARHDGALASSLSNLANSLLAGGRPEEAQAAVSEAVDIQRRLAAINPPAHEPKLARLLPNLGMALSATGRVRDASAVTDEALALLQRLAQENPAAHEPRRARALTILADQLARADRRSDALAAAERAVDAWQRLAQENPRTDSSSRKPSCCWPSSSTRRGGTTRR